MDFRENMQVREESSGTGFRLFYLLPFENDIELSIQASYGHYCTPRQTYDLYDYESMEVAVFKDNEFVNLADVSDNESLIERLEQCDAGGVYGHVPIDLIQDIVDELQLGKLKEEKIKEKKAEGFTPEDIFVRIKGIDSILIVKDIDLMNKKVVIDDFGMSVTYNFDDVEFDIRR